MNDLNKQQFILLVLLVSFVSSIATGIITTTLLNEAPSGVTTTINRVVEKTIQTVTPGTNTASVVEHTTTTNTVQEQVTVSEDELIRKAVANNQNKIVRISEVTDSGASLFGLGVVVDSRGILITDGKGFAPSARYIAKFSDGKVFSLQNVAVDDVTGLVYFKVNTEGADYSFPVVTFATPQLGQSVISLAGSDKDIYIGRVTGFGYPGTTQGTATSIDSTNTISSQPASRIKTNLNIAHTLFGGPLVDLNGDVVAIRTFSENSLELGSELSTTAIWDGTKLTEVLKQ
jgi:S1-C subfamily serine protease